MKEHRILAYDLLKAIAIYLVCLYHFGTIDYSFNTNEITPYTAYFNYFIYGLSSIGVPIFFMVNGALLLNRSYDLKKHLRKTLSVGILLLFWSAFTLVIASSKQNVHYSFSEFFKTIYNLKSSSLQHLWFLQAIIYIYLMFPIIKAVYDRNEAKLSTYLLLLIFVFTFGMALLQALVNMIGYFLKVDAMKTMTMQPYYSWLNPFGVYFSYALVYFLLGGLLVKNNNSVKVNKATIVILFFACWCLLFLFGLMQTDSTGLVYDTVYKGYNSIMVLVMTTCIFLYFLKTTFNKNKVANFITIIGSNTLGIYLVHVPVGMMITGYYYKLSLSKYLISDLLYALLIIVLSLMVTLLLKQIPVVKKLVEI